MAKFGYNLLVEVSLKPSITSKTRPQLVLKNTIHNYVTFNKNVCNIWSLIFIYILSTTFWTVSD